MYSFIQWVCIVHTPMYRYIGFYLLAEGNEGWICCESHTIKLVCVYRQRFFISLNMSRHTWWRGKTRKIHLPQILSLIFRHLYAICGVTDASPYFYSNSVDRYCRYFIHFFSCSHASLTRGSLSEERDYLL